ncbi:MAG: SsrA-binding protein SmpB [Candidatus Cloacimonetes bacterium]|nr:SsrA-binding protein SmpB [Candidatus Cloacimonadota bacterium]MBL7107877.1 SsrA-binding protein SmpB [Candidatus Cloacimonadota bacterium]
MEYKNRKARRNYQIFKSLEVGIVLTGNEIKSIRTGKLNFKDSYAIIENEEVWLFNLHISPYDKGSYQDYSPDRKRKLLLKKNEISRLGRKVTEKGFTLIPIRLYINENGFAKIELGLAKGKKIYEKRDKIRERDIQKEMKKVN